MNKILQFLLIFLWAAGLPSAVYADREDFSAFLQKLREESVIPDTAGKISSYSGFEDSLAFIGAYEWFPFAKGSNFVFSARADWLSAIQNPTADVSGCGLVFGADAESNNHLMVSLRMDGKLYVTGMKNYTKLSYAKSFINDPSSMSGSAELQVVLNGNLATVYIDGKKAAPPYEVSVMGPDIGFAVLSGTNKDFGTRCTWNDIFLYTWE